MMPAATFHRYVPGPTPTFSRADLIGFSVRWLKKTMRCSVVFSGLAAESGERPDALGWTSDQSFTIQCFSERRAFLADLCLPWRMNPETGVGRQRYYLVPAGLVHSSEPKNGWGLLFAHADGRVEIITKAKPVENFRMDHEMNMLLVALCRAEVKLARPLHEFLQQTEPNKGLEFGANPA